MSSILTLGAKQLGAVVGYGVALQASCLEGFDSLGLHQFNGLHVLAGKYAVGHSPSEALVQFQRSPPILSLCNVNLVDGLIWSQEAVRSNRTMETNSPY